MHKSYEESRTQIILKPISQIADSLQGGLNLKGKITLFFHKSTLFQRYFTEAVIPQPHASESSSPFRLKIMKDIYQGLSIQIFQNRSKSGRKYPPIVDKSTAKIMKAWCSKSIDARQ
jgi:hypothetical protein